MLGTQINQHLKKNLKVKFPCSKGKERVFIKKATGNDKGLTADSMTRGEETTNKRVGSSKRERVAGSLALITASSVIEHTVVHSNHKKKKYGTINI